MMTAQEMTIKLSAESREYDTPWRAKGHKVLDCDGRVVAVATNETDARVMAQSMRMSALLWTIADFCATRKNLASAFESSIPHIWKNVRDTLTNAGRDMSEVRLPGGAEAEPPPMSAADPALLDVRRRIDAIDDALLLLGRQLWPADAEPLLPEPLDGAISRDFLEMSSALDGMIGAFSRYSLMGQVPQAAPPAEPAADIAGHTRAAPEPQAADDSWAVEVLTRILRLSPQDRTAVTNLLAALTRD